MSSSSGPKRGLVTQVLIGLVHLYRYTGSAWLAGRCRFVPSCSAYGLQALAEHGGLLGCRLTVRRVLRCQPWSGKYGWDPVPRARTQGEKQRWEK